jgi:hypothetical protein
MDLIIDAQVGNDATVLLAGKKSAVDRSGDHHVFGF